MGLIKIRGWQLILITLIVIPVLRRVADVLDKKAKETPGEWDDIAVGALKTAIEVLQSPEIFEQT